MEKLDSVVKSNKVLLSLVGERDMLISLHKTRPANWDFLLILDMQKTSKMDLLKDQVETVLVMSGFTVTNRMHNSINIFEMRDPETRDIFYIAFVDNHLVGSYTSGLVESAIDSRNKPKIGLDQSFIETEKLVSGKGLVRVFVNYARVPQFMSIYLGTRNEYIDLFSNSMNFAGLYLNTNKERMEVKGYTLTVLEKEDKSDTIKGEDISLAYVENDDVKNAIKKQNAFLWPSAFFVKSSTQVTIEVSYDKEALEEQINNLQSVKVEQIPPTNAISEV